MAAWPSTLPLPLRSGFSIARQSGIDRTDMETGPARQRRRTRSKLHEVPIAWLLTEAQMVAFQAFFDDDINAGADWFTATWRLWDGPAARELRFISGEFSAEPAGRGYWRVTAKLDWRAA